MVRDLIGEVVGLSPYEKRLLDMLKTGGVSSEKRMYKFAKRRVRIVGSTLKTLVVQIIVEVFKYVVSDLRNACIYYFNFMIHLH